MPSRGNKVDSYILMSLNLTTICIGLLSSVLTLMQSDRSEVSPISIIPIFIFVEISANINRRNI
jgi:hypothetical protein